MRPLKVEYVASALGMGSVFQKMVHDNAHFQGIAERIPECTKIVQARWDDYYTLATPVLSGLYNAFTEEKFLQPIKRLNNLGLRHFYADSGGLQMVTAGYEITNEIKQEIYRVQCYAEYAMCFDVIPLRTVSVSTSRNERVNTSNKIFDRSRLSESAVATGQNIKSQCRYFAEHDAPTKVIIIAQGNTPDDMLRFYSTIQDQLSDEDMRHIGGIAIADTCMGNGADESVDMLIAARRIAANAPEAVSKHLHLLGVGAIARMRPVLQLLRSGYLNTYERLSYDSSTHTSAHMYGWMKLDGRCDRMGEYRNDVLEGHVRNIYQLFKPILEEFGSEDWYVNEIFFAEDGTWHYPERRDRALAINKSNILIPTSLIKWMFILYMIENFGRRLHDLLDSKENLFNIVEDSALMSLGNVKDDVDMIAWRRDIGSSLRSTRISTDSMPTLF